MIEIDLPKPRRFADLTGDDRVNEIKMRVLSLLHEEVMKSFASGSRAATDFIDAYRRRLGSPDRAPQGAARLRRSRTCQYPSFT